MKRIRQFLESIVFAGMKPGGQAASKPRFKWLGPLRAPVERVLSGGVAPTDPLYLTNRDPIEKLKSWSLVVIPCVILAVGVAYTLRTLNPPEVKRAAEPTAAEIAAKMQLPKDLSIPQSPEVQVAEVHVQGTRVYGAVQNTGTREIPVVKIGINLLDAKASQIGDVEVTVEKLAPSSRKDFQLAIRQRNAAFAMVREIIVP